MAGNPPICLYSAKEFFLASGDNRPKQFEILVEKVNGHCTHGYKEGDTFIWQGLDTPVGGFCGGAYTTLFPILVALFSGARFHFEKNPLSKTKMACPDNGNVIFKVTLLAP
jgi:uncharacterized repeat protein (TIGR04076 family)